MFFGIRISSLASIHAAMVCAFVPKDVEQSIYPKCLA
ncbi:MAG: hypothetical protein ACI901_001025 [Octadecabacter sp.]